MATATPTIDESLIGKTVAIETFSDGEWTEGVVKSITDTEVRLTIPGAIFGAAIPRKYITGIIVK